MLERQGLLNFNNKDVTIIGPDVLPGDLAPDFTVQANDWSLVTMLGATAGKVRIIASLPSLSTSVCDRETRKFNQEASQLGENVVILLISMDLPWTQKQWCGAAGIDRVVTLSDHLTGEFGMNYGVLVKEYRILRRAVWVINTSGEVVYSAYMPALGVEPDYEAVLAAARQALPVTN